MSHQLFAKSVQIERPQDHLISSHSATNSSGAPHPILRLQRQIGNQAVQQLVQAKLKFSQPTDLHEQEADRIAAQVTSGLPQTEQQNGFSAISDNASVQTGCEAGLAQRGREPASTSTTAYPPNSILH